MPTDDVELNRQVAKTVEACRARFGQPEWIVVAPARVNLIGEHVDYNDGLVLPMAIDRYVVIAAVSSPARPSTAVFHSMEIGDSHSMLLEEKLQPGSDRWTNYVEGVVDGFKSLGHVIPSCSAVISSSVPIGSGLGSSAALEVATATLLESILQVSLDSSEKALLCQRAENQFAGVPCGIMDQFASVYGRSGNAILLDCRSLNVQWVPFNSEEVSILVANTNVTHKLAESQYRKRREECRAAAEILGVPSLRKAPIERLETFSDTMDDVLYRRAWHVISEMDRVQVAADAMEHSDWYQLGILFYESHESLRDDFEVSCDELDTLVEIALSIGIGGGVYGARMTGGGFGGCTITLVETKRIEEISAEIRQQYHAATERQATVFACHAVDGCRLVEMV